MDHEELLGQIGTLLASSSRDLELLERTLTDGYATALSLEGERWRLTRRLGAVASTPADGDLEARARELSELAQRIEVSEATLVRLRQVLSRLRGEYSQAAAAAGASRR